MVASLWYSLLTALIMGNHYLAPSCCKTHECETIASELCEQQKRSIYEKEILIAIVLSYLLHADATSLDID